MKSEKALLKRLLEERRAELTRLMDKRKTKDLHETEVGDEADAASESSEKEILFELTDAEKSMLEAIEESLAKIKKGGYGLCERCRKKIAFKRLKAMPFTRYCIRCQPLMDRKG